MWVNPSPAPSIHVAMRSPLPLPCVPDRPYKILLAQVGTLSFSHPLQLKEFPPLSIVATLAGRETDRSVELRNHPLSCGEKRLIKEKIQPYQLHSKCSKERPIPVPEKKQNRERVALNKITNQKIPQLSLTDGERGLSKISLSDGPRTCVSGSCG